VFHGLALAANALLEAGEMAKAAEFSSRPQSGFAPANQPGKAPTWALDVPKTVPIAEISLCNLWTGRHGLRAHPQTPELC
jgi:hypothetical protein